MWYGSLLRIIGTIYKRMKTGTGQFLQWVKSSLLPRQIRIYATICAVKILIIGYLGRLKQLKGILGGLREFMPPLKCVKMSTLH
jgi:hypothetical protein